MKIDLTKVEFNNDDLMTIHDTLCNALNKIDLTIGQIIEYWNKLPEDIKLDCLKYGADDTPTRESMYVWFKENCK